MRIKVLHHDPEQYEAKPGLPARHYRNNDPASQPFQRAREYQRAVVAAKMKNMFSKPFVASLEGHNDSVECMVRSRTMIAPMFTGSADGEVRFWNIPQKRCFKAIRAHQGFVRGITTTCDDRYVLSCGDDKTIKLWEFDVNHAVGETSLEEGKYQDVATGTVVEADDETPVALFHSASMVASIDAHAKRQNVFATAAEGVVNMWDVERPGQAVQTFEWNIDGLRAMRFNPAEDALLGVTAQDNSIMIYDCRAHSGVRKVVLRNRSNALCWNPREPNMFTVANEDSRLYTFDMRNMKKALKLHRGHVQAVCDVDYNRRLLWVSVPGLHIVAAFEGTSCSPNGQQFASAGYDKTVRVFSVEDSLSKQAYHTKRMQRVHAARYSGDGRFIVSGSMDGNVRVWKERADEKLGVLNEREKRARLYRDKLVAKYGRMEEVEKITRLNRLPKWIKSESKRRHHHLKAQDRREENRIKHSKPGSVQKRNPWKDVVAREGE